MANIHSQVLWIHDQDDKVTPLKDIQPLIENKADNLEFVITKGLGHSRIYRDEEVIKKVVGFF
jgi:pimeloyl-ACP methyl ester carboxylesterase